MWLIALIISFSLPSLAMDAETALKVLKTRVCNKASAGKNVSKTLESETALLWEDMREGTMKGFEYQQLRSQISSIEASLEQTSKSKRELKQLLEKAEQLKAELAHINDRFVVRLEELYSREGIAVDIRRDVEGNLLLDVDVTKNPAKKEAIEFYQQIKKEGDLQSISISLYDNAVFGSRGFFQSQGMRMELGPGGGIQLLDDYVNTTGKHESRHYLFMMMRKTKKPSLFHMQYMASPNGKRLNEHGFYDEYMSAEEVYAHSTDLQTLAQIFKGESVTDLAQRENLLNQIAEKSDSLRVIAGTVGDLNKGMENSVIKAIHNKKPLPFWQDNLGNYTLELSDQHGRVGAMVFTSQEERNLFPAVNLAYKKVQLEVSKHVSARINSFPKEELQKLTPQQFEVLNESLVKEFMNSKQGKSALNNVGKAAKPILQMAQKKLQDLRKLTEFQVAETRKLDSLIKAYAEEGKPEQLKALRAQMFKMGKNVKEDYKGFPLKETKT